MTNPTEQSVKKAIDRIQQRLTDYACDLEYEDLPHDVIRAAKLGTIDMLGALVGGFFGEPCRIARDVAAQMPSAHGATVIGTQMKSPPEMAAFVNGITARCAELMDVYHWPGSMGGHPSETVMPALAAAEHVHADGRAFITSIVLAYEVHTRISDVCRNEAFDNTNFTCLGTAVAAGKLLGLSPAQLSHCISMAIVPNVTLEQAKNKGGYRSMFKAVAVGQAGRAGVFAAMLARAGMEGPHLPFEGKAGWCDHVAGVRFTLDTLGGNGTPFKILHTRIKNRPAAGIAIAPILAAEKVAPLNIKDVKHITVEVHKIAKERTGTGEQPWNVDTREAADHSTPYLVAMTLRDGTVTMRSFNNTHLVNPELRLLMRKIEVVENKDYTRDYERVPQAHRARVTVITASGERLVAESGGDEHDLSAQRSDAQIMGKFRGLTEDYLGTKRVNSLLDRLGDLENMKDVAEIPAALVLG